MQSKQPYAAFGKFLRDKRVEMGLKQTDVSQALSYTPQFICNWEKGKSMPPFDKLYLLSKLYKINPEILISRILEIQEESLRSHFKLKKKAL